MEVVRAEIEGAMFVVGGLVNSGSGMAGIAKLMLFEGNGN
jgi:hypothetical protein